MKKTGIILVLLGNLFFSPPHTLAEATIQTNEQPLRNNIQVERDEPDFSSQKEMIDIIEEEMNNTEESNNQKLPDIVANIIFRMTFEANIPILNLKDDLIVTDDSEVGSFDWYTMNWYDQLDNTSDRYITANETYQDIHGDEINRPIKLRSRYIDNGSDTTVLINHGWRTPWNKLIKPAKFFSDEGYNVMMISNRALNGSGGKYFTFGYSEQSDLNQWIEDEVTRTAPNQKIVLMGVSMGASVVMMSQNNPHPNVAAYIEDCGFATLSDEIKHVYAGFTELIPSLKKISGDTVVEQISQRTEMTLGFSIDQIAPVDALSINQTPKLFVHGGSDDFIPLSAVEQMYDTSIGPKEKLIVAGAGHGDSYNVNPLLYQQTVQRFLQDILHKKIVSFDVHEHQVPVGTAVENLNLPEKITVILNDGSLEAVKVSNWEAIHYDDTQVGSYTFSGTLEIENQNIINPDYLKPVLTVVSQEN